MNGIRLDHPAVVVNDLVKHYPNGTEAVQGVSFTVHAGEIVGVVGPNGAGKSTTLNVLATLLSPTSGDARVYGVSVRDRDAVRPLLAVALQVTGLDPLMSVTGHFGMHAALYGIPPSTARTRSRELIDAFQLGPFRDRPAGALSGGMQRRLSLAVALMHEPRVVIFDEPTVGLDPTLKRTVWELLEAQRAAGLAVVFSTHDMNEAEQLCQRIELMSKGRIVASGTPAELKTRAGGGVLSVRTRVDAATAARAIGDAIARGVLPCDTRVLADGDVLRIQAELTDPAFVPLLTVVLERVGASIVELQWGHGSLDDVFTQLTGAAVGEEPLVGVTVEHGVHARRRRGVRR